MAEETKESEVKVIILDAEGKQGEELIPESWYEDYKAEFGRGIPHKKQFDIWKELRGKTNSSSPNMAYKLTPAAREQLHVYLNTRPMGEVEHIIAGLFEVVERDENNKPILDEHGNEKPVKDPYITKEGAQILVGYLRDKCPRGEAKEFIEMLSNGGLEQYEIKRVEKPEVVGEEKAESSDSGESTSGGAE